MPKQRRVPPAATVDALKRWQQEGAAIKRQLQDRRVALLAELEGIDEALVYFDGDRAHERPAVVTAAPAAAKVAGKKPRAAAVMADRSRAALAGTLDELRPYWGQCSGRTQEILAMRAAGKMPNEIAVAQKLTVGNVSSAISYALTKMRVARSRDPSGPRPAERDGGDQDEDPEPAVHFAIPALVYAPQRRLQTPPEVRVAACGPPGRERTKEGQQSGAGIIGAPMPAPVALPRPANASNASPGDALPTIDTSCFASSTEEAKQQAPLPELTDDELAEFDRTPLVQIRRRSTSTLSGRVKAKTIAPRRLTRDEQKLAMLLVYPDVERPRTRGDCVDMPRPCAFVGCEHHLYLDANPDTGALKINHPDLEVWQMAETCSLDVADRAGLTLEEVGAIIGCTRERVRQIEVRGLSKLREVADEGLEGQSDRPLGNLARAIDAA